MSPRSYDFPYIGYRFVIHGTGVTHRQLQWWNERGWIVADKESKQHKRQYSERQVLKCALLRAIGGNAKQIGGKGGHISRGSAGSIADVVPVLDLTAKYCIESTRYSWLILKLPIRPDCFSLFDDDHDAIAAVSRSGLVMVIDTREAVHRMHEAIRAQQRWSCSSS